MRRHQRSDTQENRVLADKIKVCDHDGVHPHVESQSIKSRAIRLAERLEEIRPSILSSIKLKDTAKSRIAEKGEATSKSCSWEEHLKQ
jgi:hypothetical protein